MADFEAQPYQVYVFDCPACSGQTSLGEDAPEPEEQCSDCGEMVAMQ